MASNWYIKRIGAKREVRWASKLIWYKSTFDGYIAHGFQASYRITKDELTDNWCAYITRNGETYKSTWRENTLKDAKESCLVEELDFARRAIQ